MKSAIEAIYEHRLNIKIVVSAFISFLVAIEGLAWFAAHPEQHIVSADSNPNEMLRNFLYNAGILALLSYALKQFSALFYGNQVQFYTSVIADLAIFICLESYQWKARGGNAGKAAAEASFFLWIQYFRVISDYFMSPLADWLSFIAQSMTHSLFIVIILRISIEPEA